VRRVAQSTEGAFVFWPGVEPLVSVGVPTYNRAALAERAIRSALAQDHGAIEVVVSDDASTDDTRERIERLAAADPRVRYLRQAANLGHARNFQAVLEAARGEYFMWLSDDDRIDPAYVSRCLAVLRAEPGTALVCGLARYEGAGDLTVDERPMNLVAARPGARLLRYLARVNMNGPLFGVARRADLLQLGFPDVVGGDWLLVSALATRGRVRTLRDVRIHRSFDGLSSDPGELARSFGMRGALARHHHFAVAARFGREIAAGGPYAGLGPLRRRLLAAAAALIVLRFPVHLAVRRLAERAGLAHLEARLIAWVRRND
jgi:glycosyltransferase involved in cell wall biosynthesis